MKTTGLVFAEKPSTSAEPTRLQDKSRFNNDGTHTNITMTRLPSGLWVRSFNGTSSKVNVSDHSSLNIENEISLVLWIRPVGDNVYGCYLCKQDSYMIGQENTDETMIRLELRGLTTEVLNSDASALDVDKYNFLVATYTSGTRIIYVDGVNVKSDAPTGTITTSALDVRLGALANDTQWFGGLIGLPRIYNYSLCASKVREIFQSERHLFGV